MQKTNDVVEALLQRCALPEGSPEHVSPERIRALLEGRLVPVSERDVLGRECVLIAVDAMIGRLIEFGYHLELARAYKQKKSWTARVFRQTWPSFVRMPTCCQGRLDRVVLVGAAIAMQQLLELLSVEVHIDLDQCTDTEAMPPRQSDGMRWEWYVAFGQWGTLYPRTPALDVGRMCSPTYEVGLTIREALHVALQHPLPLYEKGLMCGGTRYVTPGGEERIPVLRYEDGRKRFVLNADKLDVGPPGAGVGTRAAQVVGVG